MSLVAVLLALAPLALVVFAYVAYPALLWLAASFRKAPARRGDPAEWPVVTVTIPVYNGEAVIGPTIERVLDLDYPRDRMQVIVISDASTDGSDDVVRGYASRGVELVRLPQRLGKTVAENTAVAHARGDIIVNVDASILVPRDSLKPLVREFADPTVGVVSGRDVSVGDLAREGNSAESGYVGYEMWVRSLETRVGSIVGASGCFYGFRRAVHEVPLPEELSWDFASALVARELGFRAVSATDAVCIVPRTKALRTELKRKVRTMARGLSTLFYKRKLMNPFAYGSFALMLIGHKLVRWLPYLLAPLALLGLAWLSIGSVVARVVLGTALAGIALGVVAIRWPRNRPIPRVVSLSGFVLAAFLAGFLAWVEALRGTRMATWEPTPRPEAAPAK